MRNIEQGTFPLAQSMLEEWLSSDLKTLPPQFELLKQVAPNTHVQTYRVHTSEGDLFTKIYIDTPSVAEKEKRNYDLFKDLPFIPKLKYTIFPNDSQKRLLSYRYIDNEDLHKQFTLSRKEGKYLDKSIIHESLFQTYQMGEIIKNRTDIPIPEIPWPLKSPIRNGFISKELENEFLKDYQIVFEKNLETIKLFPGFYFDRNPRNIMKDSKSIWQVDFGVIEKSSIIFDLVKMIRNGTDLDLPIDERYSWQYLSSYPLNFEQEFINTAYYLSTKNNHRSTNSKEKFAKLFDYAVIHNHFFYLTKYGKMYRENKGDVSKLSSRFIYHVGGLQFILNKINQQGENMYKLKEWLNEFTKYVCA